MPDSEPLSPQQRPPHPRLRPWRDAAAVGGLLLAVNALAAPHDPGWFLLNPSPWLLLPGLIGMRHGFRWGFLIGSAASLAVLGMLSVFQPGLPGVNLVYFLSLPAAGLLSGAAHRLENGPVNDPGTGRETEDDTAEGRSAPAPAPLPAPEMATEPAPSAPDSTLVLLRSQLEESDGIRRELASRLEEKGNEILGLNRQCGDLSRQQEALRLERDALSAELVRRADDPRALEEKQALFLRQQRREEDKEAEVKAIASQTDTDADAAAMEETRLTLQRETLQAAVERRDAVRAYVERRREAWGRLAEQEARHGREVQALHSERDALTSRLEQAARRLTERGDELEVMVSCQGETQAMLAAREHALSELAGRLETLDAVVADRDRMIESLRLELERRMAIPQAVEPEAKQEKAEKAEKAESEPAHAVSLLWSEAHDALRTETRSEAGVPGGTIVASVPLGAWAGEEISTSEPPQALDASSEFKAPESQDQERQVQIQTLERELAGCREMMDQLTAQRDELAARLEERLSLLEILTEERAALTDKLAERGEALRKVEAARDTLDAHADHRNGLLKPVTARSLPQARRPSRRNVGPRHQNSPDFEMEDGPVGIPPRLAVEGGRDFLSGMAMTAEQEAEEAPLEPQFRSLFLAGAGPVFPHLLMLLEETAGVTDAAFYQIDGTRLERSTLRGEGGMLPGTMPLATAEIAALAVARQSFVTCRQVWATVPVQDSPWLAALPWPSDGFHCTSLLLIHRMHAGEVNRRTFSRIQLICRWVARFMELHGLKGATSEPAGGALTVRPEVMRRALLDAAAAYREQGLCSSTLTLRLNGESQAHQEHLLKTVLAHLRPTDLICQERAAPVTAGDPSSAPSSVGAAVTMEILLTFSDPVEAEEITGPLAHAIDGDPALCGAVTLSPPSLVGG